MDRLLRTLLSLKEIKVRRDDDFTDRLSRSYTTSLLVMASMVVTTKLFVGEPISCWCPAFFTDSHRQYANTICWISNTYYVPFETQIPDDFDEQEWIDKQKISYYQWVPLILLCQATLALVPCLFWRFLNIRSGIDVSGILESASVCQRATYNEIREKTIRYMVNQIDRYLLSQRDFRKGCCVRCKEMLARYCFLVGGKRQGNYLAVAYIVCKILYIANAVGQLFLMDLFMGLNYKVFGMQVVMRMIRGEDWSELDRFPRVTLCNFKIRHENRIHDYVVQCALTINLFNEKIFIIIWFWYVFVAVVTVGSFFIWVLRAIYWPAQIDYVKQKLRGCDVTHRSKANLHKFVQYYLRRDGVFLIRLISLNIGDIVAAETLAGLWEHYGPDRRLLTEHPSRGHRTVVSGKESVHGPPGNMDVV